MRKNIKYIHEKKVHNLEIPQQIVPEILKYFKIRTVIDMWWWIWAFTKVFLDNGIDAICVDWPWVNKNNLYIDEKYFIERDFEQYNVFWKKYDLAFSLEVAEHLQEKSAKNFVKTLCNCADYVIFSAAVPYQWWQNHINEQSPEYWKTLFENEWYEICDCLRILFRDNKKIPWWYKNNIFLYHKKWTNIPNGLNDKWPLYTIHPDAYEELKVIFNSPRKTFRHLIWVILEKLKII